MKLIKKSEKLLLEKIKIMEETEEGSLPLDIADLPEPSVIKKPMPDEDVDNREPRYLNFRDHPIVQSVGNSGWQVSEIWKEIRLDDFDNI
ncbi:hypothetical protein [Calothrix sp. PCC 7507]|uniref:hypothetical protein n=1 Tax=Calothrix sp. PCC 7507 TaxID=99598 RepID=UPI00029F10ED|nr:hypothetical protein [Calothrix sp. PCC 7507]AFY31127.1 hypothetical protein Cal7507_0638 [Calothrix sp. PCC 7507]